LTARQQAAPSEFSAMREMCLTKCGLLWKCAGVGLMAPPGVGSRRGGNSAKQVGRCRPSKCGSFPGSGVLFCAPSIEPPARCQPNESSWHTVCRVKWSAMFGVVRLEAWLWAASQLLGSGVDAGGAVPERVKEGGAFSEHATQRCERCSRGSVS